MAGLPGIDVKKVSTNPTIDSEESFYEIPFYKDCDYFFSVENEVSFVKAVERAVRTSKYYSRYIAYLKQDLGMTFCQVKGNIMEDEVNDKKDLIEMHHGVCFTLFDVTSIVLGQMLHDGEKITTFSVANKVMEEHYKLHVQTVMLCKTVHQMVHEHKISLNYKQSFGDLVTFLEDYYNGLTEEHVRKIQDVLDKSEKYDSNDFGNLEVILTRWRTDNPEFDEED